MSLTEKTDHVEEAISNLIEFFKRKPKMVSTLTAFVNQIQDLEIMFFQLLNEVTLDNAIGVQLDGIGAIVGEEREGRNDDDYRLAIRVRILLNLSNGTPEEILTIVDTMLGDRDLEFLEYFPAAFTLQVVSKITTNTAIQVNKKIQSAKLGGVRAHLIYGNSLKAGWFRFEPKAWTISTAYVVGDHAVNDTSPVKIYICTTGGTSAGSGGPTGTGTGISDGSVVWDYVKDVIAGKGWDNGKWVTAIE